MPTKPPALLCVLLKDVPPGASLPPGMTTSRCDGCRLPVLLSASSRPLVDGGDARPVCRHCMPRGKNLITVMTPAQAAELLANQQAQRHGEAERN